ncbi:hypothetical protein Y1Q_0008465 [Alligator mississippiensis]|uniref:Uncharacterized protein n=1 Tax=Alligator mississippiensis TaxID=8496 RepID=A0A151MUU9_ALLMI|nr:hypothetical protein Y1Q_0008465 [Alligator mississippiensis]
MGPQDASVSDSASLSIIWEKPGSSTCHMKESSRFPCSTRQLDPQGTTDHHLQVKPRTIAVRPGVGSGIVAENHRGGARQSSQGILTRITTVT